VLDPEGRGNRCPPMMERNSVGERVKTHGLEDEPSMHTDEDRDPTDVYVG
jgi:hypothetical protein